MLLSPAQQYCTVLCCDLRSDISAERCRLSIFNQCDSSDKRDGDIIPDLIGNKSVRNERQFDQAVRLHKA